MYYNLNDYEILYMISEDRDTNFEVLFDKYKPLIYRYAKSYLTSFKNFGYELDDLVQLGYLALYKAMLKYDFYNHSMFFSYFKTVLVNLYQTEIRNNQTYKKAVLNQAFSYNNLVLGTDLEYIEVLADSNNYQYQIENNLQEFKNTLSFDEGNVFELYYHGFSIREIYLLLDMSEKLVKQYLTKIKKAAKAYRNIVFDV